MKAVLKYVHSPDVLDLQKFIPEIEDNFSILLQLIVGPLNGEGEESFDVLLCTPQWLSSNHEVSDIIIGRHYLIIFEYNFQRLYDWLKNTIEKLNGDTWEELGMKIGQIGKWEFEDYQAYN